jgi:hypothetical protein
MKAYFASLSSLERRFVVGVMAAVFVLLNAVFVWPLFSDWGRMQFRLTKAYNKLSKFQNEIAQAPKYDALVRKMQEAGQTVPPEDQSVDFVYAIQSQAVQSGVTIVSSSSLPLRTNQFFLERAQNIAIKSGESQLVDFLYRLGAGTSLTRVRGLSLRPDPQRHELTGNITLVASYQKNQKKTAIRRVAPAVATADKPPASTAKPVAPSPKPATPTPKKP